MLFTIQFPLADLRRFTEDGIYLLTRPAWPTAAPYEDFVRSFGPIRPRPSGGIDKVGEHIICEAKRALRFDNLLPLEMKSGRVNLRGAFRRFYFDGYVVGKFEVGIGVDIRNELSRFETEGLINHILNLEVRVPNPLDPLRQPYSCKLIDAGEPLAHLYTLSTMKNSSGAKYDLGLVKSNTPMLIVVRKSSEKLEIPFWGEALPLEYDFALSHFRVPIEGKRLDLWEFTLQPDRQYDRHNSQTRSLARRVRIVLSRLYAERVCLLRVLQAISSKKIIVEQDTALGSFIENVASERLQEYLRYALRRIRRNRKKAEQISEHDIIELIKEFEDSISPGQRYQLIEAVKQLDIRPNMPNIRRGSEPFIRFGNFYSSEINIRSVLDNVKQKIENATTVPSRLQDLVDDLSSSLEDVAKTNPHEAEWIAKEACIVVEEAAKEKPNKKLLEISAEGLKEAAKAVPEVAPTITSIATQIVELVGGVAASDYSRGRQRASALSQNEEPPTPRYADFTFYLDKEGNKLERVPEGEALRQGQWYQLEVAVQEKPIGIPIETSERRPVREPKRQAPVLVMVTAEAEDDHYIEIEEPVQYLELPPSGSSTKNAFFRVRPLRQSAGAHDLAEIRIRLYYQFNLLERAIIRAEVIGQFDREKTYFGLLQPITFRQEELEHPYLDLEELKPRQLHIDITKPGNDYRFTFTFYSEADKKVIFTAPVRLGPDELEDELVKIRELLQDIAMSKTFTTRLEGDDDEFLKDIRKLAQAGRRLWSMLFRRDVRGALYRVGKWLGDHPLQPGSLVQVSVSSAAANFVFPWGLLYDRTVPREQYELPALEGFWGVRYEVEQRVPMGAFSKDVPVVVKKLKIAFMLWDQFRNVALQKRLLTEFAARNKEWLEVTAPPITAIDTCYELLKNCDAHVLYFYTHGYTRQRLADIGGRSSLERFITTYEGLAADDPRRDSLRFIYESVKDKEFNRDRSWIALTYGKLYLDELYDQIEGPLETEPLVILNMCESAQVTPALSESFIHFFLNRGARAVVGTECPMTVEFAHPFAEKLLEHILSGETVGQALLNARRHFLMHAKNPLGLAYSLFGAATMRFEPPSFES
jgi:hypothetical protein